RRAARRRPLAAGRGRRGRPAGGQALGRLVPGGLGRGFERSRLDLAGPGRPPCLGGIPPSSGAPPWPQHSRAGFRMKTYSKDSEHGIRVTLNGAPRSGLCEPRTLLSDFLRAELGATGTHVGCEHGVCGACTVQIDGVAVRSCMTLAMQVEDRKVM